MARGRKGVAEWMRHPGRKKEQIRGPQPSRWRAVPSNARNSFSRLGFLWCASAVATGGG